MKNKNNFGFVDALILSGFFFTGVFVSISEQNPLEMIRFLAIGVGSWCVYLGIKELSTKGGR